MTSYFTKIKTCIEEGKSEEAIWWLNEFKVHIKDTQHYHEEKCILLNQHKVGSPIDVERHRARARQCKSIVELDHANGRSTDNYFEDYKNSQR
jgi:hypothetical protein